MLIQPYQLDELRFAWCYRVYYRWKTHRSRRQPALRELGQETMDAMLQPYGVRILEASAGESDMRVLASLLPNESVASCAGKTKGRVSRWLRERLGLEQAEKLLSRGYFASTTGQSAAEAVDRYLDQQGGHHGYASRPRPPVFVERYPFTGADEDRLRASHAVTVLQFHVVLSTWKRQGVFSRAAGEAVASRWWRLAETRPLAIEKVSFVPDHVHLAVRAHPSMSPAEFVVELMNASQERMWNDFADLVIEGGVDRLWQPSAYIGSYGDLESRKIAGYVRNWEASPDL